MVSRRLLRIKAMQMLYAFHQSENPSLSKFEKELFFSIDKIYELYHLMLLLIVDISDFFDERSELSKNKHIPTEEEKNPNTKFLDNKIIKQIANNKKLKEYCNSNKLNWSNYPELIRKFYQEIKDSDAYAQYMSNPESSFKSDKEIVANIYENIIATSESLHEILEEKSIYWNDDIEFVVSMIIKTIYEFRETQSEDAKLLPLFKNDEDREYIKTLFHKAIMNHKENSELIDQFTTKWDLERIAFMDIILMELALTEVTEISSVPIKVSIN